MIDIHERIFPLTFVCFLKEKIQFEICAFYKLIYL